MLLLFNLLPIAPEKCFSICEALIYRHAKALDVNSFIGSKGVVTNASSAVATDKFTKSFPFIDLGALFKVAELVESRPLSGSFALVSFYLTC